MNVKNPASLGEKLYWFSVYFFLIFNLLLGIVLASYASYLLIFRQEKRFEIPKAIIFYFLMFSIIFTAFTTFIGWLAATDRSTKCFRIYAILLGIGIFVHVAGSLWCFITLPKIKNDVIAYTDRTFNSAQHKTSDTEAWWNIIQRKLKCCGVNGPNDYKSKDAIPFSCCGTDIHDSRKGNCDHIYQKGCSQALADQVSYDLIYLCLAALGICILQIPAIFVYWLHNRIIENADPVEM